MLILWPILDIQYFGHLMQRADSFERPWCWERLKVGGEGETNNEMVGWHHWLNGHEFGLTLGVGDGQRGLVYCGSWGRKESDTTERLTELNWLMLKARPLCTSAKSNLRDGVSGEVEKDSFIVLPGKTGHSRFIPPNLCVSAWEHLMRTLITVLQGWSSWQD